MTALEAPVVEPGDDAVHVGDVAQHVDARVIATRDRGPNRFGPGAQHELVVGLPVGSPLPEVAHLDFLGIAVDAEHVLSGPHIERKALAEAFGCLKQQAPAVRDGPTDVVGQAAVRERDVLATLQHDDLGRLVEPPQTRPRRGAGRDSPTITSSSEPPFVSIGAVLAQGS